MSDKTVGEAIYHLMGWSNVDDLHESLPGFNKNMPLESVVKRLAITDEELMALSRLRRLTRDSWCDEIDDDGNRTSLLIDTPHELLDYIWDGDQ